MNSLFPVSRHGYNPFSITASFDELVDSFFTAPVKRVHQPTRDVLALTPRANILHHDNGYTIEMAAPGLSRGDFELGVKNNTLSVSVSTEDTKEYISSLALQEYSYSSFSRSWTLPSDINVAGISARYEAGILTIDVPTLERAADSVTIDIK